MAFDPISSALNFGGQIIDKIWPDKNEADKAKIRLLELQQKGQFTELEYSFKAIIAEAQSNDPWTSRARPAFLWVIYIMILSSIPMGILYAINPIIAQNVTDGVVGWLKNIPTELYTLFGAGYLGYGTFRSIDKNKAK